MDLPFLPAEHVGPIFECFHTKAGTQPLQQHGPHFISVCTNSEVEWWHCHLNHLVHMQLLFYAMVACLQKQACTGDMQVQLVFEKKLKSLRQGSLNKVHNLYHNVWTAYAHGEKNAKQLLYAG